MIPNRVPRIRVNDAAALAAEFVQLAESCAAEAIETRGVFTLAIPGGSAAEQLCPALAHARLSWLRVHIFWCDERVVPVDDASSNAGLLRRLWKGTRALSEANLHPMPVMGSDITAAATHYAKTLEAVCGSPPMLDLALLGVGEDGHVASLFPGRGVDEAMPDVIVVDDAPKAPARRLSLSLGALLRARRIVVAAFGAAKAEVIRGALGDQTDTPIARFMRPATELFLDHEAASLLSLPTLRAQGQV